MDVSLVISLALAVPIGIFSNLITPMVQRRWAATNEKRKQKRIAKLETELKRLKGNNTAHSEMLSAPFQGTKQPNLKYQDFTTVGLGNSVAQELRFGLPPQGLAIFLRNTEERFETRAHNLKASLILRSIDGKEIRIEKVPWFQNTSNVVYGNFFKESVTIGMLEIAGVVCAISRESKFYIAIYDTGTVPKEGQQISYGEWHLHLRIEGDNAQQTYQGKLQLLPDGSSGFVLASS